MMLNSLAVLRKKEEKYGEAEEMYERALVIFELSAAPDHSKVITCSENYAYLLRKMNRTKSA